jgi:hypothetical protein
MAVGLVGALALTRSLRALLYGVGPADPLSLAAISAVVVGVSLLACWIPGLQATRVDPMTALRRG